MCGPPGHSQEQSRGQGGHLEAQACEDQDLCSGESLGGRGKFAFIGSFYAGDETLFEKGCAAGECKEMNGLWFTKSQFLSTGTRDTDSFTTETEYAGLGGDAKIEAQEGHLG